MFLVSGVKIFIIIYCETWHPRFLVSGENIQTWYPMFLVSGDTWWIMQPFFHMCAIVGEKYQMFPSSTFDQCEVFLFKYFDDYG